ncbi:C25 family cysteine peptidase [Siphonobacter sp. SORGH_AS_1065]|uniref:putative type IX secretion system sortase PorU2 n=1 Tax=Siphonobacter sp. SORGH_AS_1065 TaxID=3041795 RepID=UPI002789D290|nr:C25 family cysteine peptidase [Siphonobacter sp. SORGH_AS_1065]MDQ1086428.1 hypothetical protein [Siphonobacter sp. SORGH_AS_1065]
MKKIYFLLLVLSLGWTTKSFSQQFGNEWINYQQTYFKIPVTQKGIYRLTYTELQNAGFDLKANPQQIQLFRRGVEQAITVVGEGDGTFDTGDYVEFFGVGNDGSRDAELYVPKESHHNPYVSLFTENSYYFLTLTVNGQKGKRVSTPTPPSKGTLAAEPYHWAENVSLFTSHYDVGPAYSSAYTQMNFERGMTLASYGVGKGYMDSPIGNNNRKAYNLPLENPYQAEANTVKPRLSISLFTANIGNHEIEVSIRPSSSAAENTILTFPTTTDYQILKNSAEFDWSFLTNSSSQAVVYSKVGSASVIYFKFTYPQLLNLSGVTQGKAINTRTNPSGTSLLQFSNANTNDQLYDVTDLNNIQRIQSSFTSNTLEAVVSNTQQARNFWVNRSSGSVSKIEKINFIPIDPSQVNYLIVTNKVLRQAAGGSSDIVQAYADYRASVAGGGYKPLVVDMDVLSNQFNYGERSGLSIRNFAGYMLKNGSPKHLFLIGRGIFPQYFRFGLDEQGMADNSLVPTGGWPGSDWLLVNGLNGEPANVPAIAVGRLNVTKPDEIASYLSKIKEYELSKNQPWRKKFLYLSGGHTDYERSSFTGYATDFKNIVENAPLQGTGKIISKTTNQNVETIDVSPDVNDGTSMITFFGHASTNYTDINIGLASQSSYTNKGKYPIIFVNGCEAGNIFYYNAPETVGSNWVNTPDRGAIVHLASSFLGWPFYLKDYSNTLFTKLTDSEGLDKTFGTNLVRAIKAFVTARPNDAMTVGHAQEFVLQGDPAIVAYSTSSSLPVSLIYFKGQVESSAGKKLTDVEVHAIPENIGVLTWEVAQEKNILGYTVEKSLDGKNWASIGFAASKNVPSGIYTFYDTKLQVGTAYYRLKINEASEPDHYSRIIALSLAPTYGLVAYPNPASTDITISVKENTNTKAHSIQAVLLHITGQTVWKGEIRNGKALIPVQGLTRGVYTLQVNDGVSIQQQKILVTP